jgi:hypothetical protein
MRLAFALFRESPGNRVQGHEKELSTKMKKKMWWLALDTWIPSRPRRGVGVRRQK